MDASVYPDKEVTNFLATNTIAVKVNVLENPKDTDEFNAKWTPTLIFGRVKKDKFIEDYRYVGFLPLESFIPTLKIAMAVANFNSDKFSEAEKLFKEVIDKYPGTQEEAEALFWLGITRYKMKKDPTPLLEQWNIILTKYPNSIWAKKVAFIKK